MVTTRVSTITISSPARRSFFSRARKIRNAGTIITQAPMLKASTKARELTDRQTRWTTRSQGFSAVEASPRLRSTPRPMQPANTLGFMKREVMRTPSSTTLRFA